MPDLSPSDSPQPPVDNADKARQAMDSSNQPSVQAEIGEQSTPPPSVSERQPPIEKSNELVSLSPAHAGPQSATEAAEGGRRKDLSNRTATTLILLAAVANILMGFFNFQSWRSVPQDRGRQEDALRKLNEAITSINGAKASIDEGVKVQRDTNLTEKGAVAALDEAVTIIDDVRRTYVTSLLKVPTVESVRLGKVALARGSDGRYEVSSFENCPQVTIKLRNPGGLPLGGTLRVSGRKGQDPFSCNEKLTRHLQPNAEVDIQFDLGECLLHVEEITSCDGSGWLTVHVLGE